MNPEAALIEELALGYAHVKNQTPISFPKRGGA